MGREKKNEKSSPCGHLCPFLPGAKCWWVYTNKERVHLSINKGYLFKMRINFESVWQFCVWGCLLWGQGEGSEIHYLLSHAEKAVGYFKTLNQNTLKNPETSYSDCLTLILGTLFLCKYREIIDELKLSDYLVFTRQYRCCPLSSVIWKQAERNCGPQSHAAKPLAEFLFWGRLFCNDGLVDLRIIYEIPEFSFLLLGSYSILPQNFLL